MATTESLTNRLIQWNTCLAPLTDRQKDSLMILNEIHSPCTHSFVEFDASRDMTKDEHRNEITTCNELFQKYINLQQNFMLDENTQYTMYLNELKIRWKECHNLCLQIDEILSNLTNCSKQYALVSTKTMSLHHASEELTSDQKQLNLTINSINDYIEYFKDINPIMEKLDASTMSVNSEMFFNILDKIEKNMDFMQSNISFKESNTYLIKYRHCQNKAIALMKEYLFALFTKTTESILNLNENESNNENADAALALFYGRFQTILSKAKPVIEKIEGKSFKWEEYDALLSECHNHYWNERALVLGPSIKKSLSKVEERYIRDHCSLVRHSCALLLHASIDEFKLFYQFFSKSPIGLTTYLESLCNSLYDSLRPFIIHINHLETLAEICCILRIEMLDEHVQNNLEPLEGFGNICMQLLCDVQERLVFRTHLYLQTDVLNYNPSIGDLSYPEKLRMMEDIAESLREETRLQRNKKILVTSDDRTILDPVSRNHLSMDCMYQKSNTTNSPADLHGMWYPTVRRTLVCLSRLYRCVEKSVFQSLSQEAISLCILSIEKAKQEIQNRATPIDAELFQIKHLLILREQIAPFQVDFTVKEYSLDFSKVKTAAFELLGNSSRLFTLSNNALLEFLLEGAPQMKEHLIDSRKQIDSKLKISCQRFIEHSTNLLIQPAMILLEKEKTLGDGQSKESAQHIIGNAQDVAAIIEEVLRLIKFKLPLIQQSMQLYLSNKETEFILYKPIKNSITAIFVQLHQLLTRCYSVEELLLIGCPVPEQISVMLSATSLSQSKFASSEINKSIVDEQEGTNPDINCQVVKNENH